MGNADLLKSLPNPEQEQLKIYEEEGLAGYDDSPIAIFQAAILKYKDDVYFRNQIGKVEKDYEKIFNRYRLKMQSKKITEDELCELEDELIYSNAF